MILDLSVLQKETIEEQIKVEKKIIYFKMTAVFWTVFLAIYIITVVMDFLHLATLLDIAGFSLLGIQLLIINSILIRLMNTFVK